MINDPACIHSIETSFAGARCAVTGGAGFIGAAVCHQLRLAGAEVTCIDRRAALRAEDAAARYDILEEELAPVLVDADFVFHLAGRGGVLGSWGAKFDRYLRDNILATQRVLGAIAGTRARLVLASSSSVYGHGAPDGSPSKEGDPCHPLSPYASTKHAAEQLTRLYTERHGLDTVVCRLFTVYGPGQRSDMIVAKLVAASHDGVPVDLHDGGMMRRHFTFVDDAVSGLLAAGAHGHRGEVYNIAGPAVHSVAEVIAHLYKLGCAPPTRAVAAPAGLPRVTNGCLARSRAQLGFIPAVALCEGLEQQVKATVAMRGERVPR
jgi:UDP-glucuronate 4-epimerase